MKAIQVEKYPVQWDEDLEVNYHIENDEKEYRLIITYLGCLTDENIDNNYDFVDDPEELAFLSMGAHINFIAYHDSLLSDELKQKLINIFNNYCYDVKTFYSSDFQKISFEITGLDESYYENTLNMKDEIIEALYQ